MKNSAMQYFAGLSEANQRILLKAAWGWLDELFFYEEFENISDAREEYSDAEVLCEVHKQFDGGLPELMAIEKP